MVKSLDRSRKVLRCYRADRDSKEIGSMDWAIYRQVLSRNLEISIRELVLRRCRAGIKTFIKISIESPKEEILRRKNNTR